MNRHELITAITSCGHSIDHDEVTLRFDPKQEGHNAFNQLNRRILAWADKRASQDRATIKALVTALEALQLQALQSSVNDHANEWGMEALAMAHNALALAKGEDQ